SQQHARLARSAAGDAFFNRGCARGPCPRAAAAQGSSGRRMNEIAAAFVAACRDEIEAPKPGNVHIFAEGHGMTVDDFLQSAEAAAPALCDTGAPIGLRIFAAIDATFAAVKKNTNLGIILLCAPLAAASEKGGGLRESLKETLLGLTREDACLAFK